MKNTLKAAYAPHTGPVACSVERIQVPSLRQVMDETQLLGGGAQLHCRGFRKRQLMAHLSNVPLPVSSKVGKRSSNVC